MASMLDRIRDRYNNKFVEQSQMAQQIRGAALGRMQGMLGSVADAFSSDGLQRYGKALINPFYAASEIGRIAGGITGEDIGRVSPEIKQAYDFYTGAGQRQQSQPRAAQQPIAQLQDPQSAAGTSAPQIQWEYPEQNVAPNAGQLGTIEDRAARLGENADVNMQLADMQQDSNQKQDQVPNYFQQALKELKLDNEGTQKFMALDALRRMDSRDTGFNRRFDAQRNLISSKVAELQARDQLQQAKTELKADKEADRNVKNNAAQLRYKAAIAQLDAQKEMARAARADAMQMHKDENDLKKATKIQDIIGAEAKMMGRDKPAQRKISATLRTLQREDKEFNDYFVGMKTYDPKAFDELMTGAYDKNAAGDDLKEYFSEQFQEWKSNLG